MNRCLLHESFNVSCKQIIYLLLFSFFAVLPSTLKAQDELTHQIDSLQQLIESQKGDEKIATQLELAQKYYQVDNAVAQMLAKSVMEEAVETRNKNLEMQSFLLLGRVSLEFDNIHQSQDYFLQALQISDAIDEHWYKAEILLRMGTNQHSLGNTYKALEYFNKAVREGNLSENHRIVGAAYSMIGTIYRVNGLYDRAIENIIKSRLSYEKANYKEGDAWAAYLLGYIYSDLQLYKRAREYFDRSIRLYRQIAEVNQNKSGVAICLIQIGLLDLKEAKLQQARENIQTSLAIYTEAGSKYGMANAINILGRIEYQSGNYDTAKAHLQQALKMKIEIGDHLSQSGIYEYLGLCEYKQGNTEEGINTILKGLALAGSNNQKKKQVDIYDQLANIYLEQNNLKEAFKYQKKHLAVQDSMLMGAASIKMDQLQDIYEMEAKNNLIAELEKQNAYNTLLLKQHRTSRIFMVATILVALLLAGILYWFNRRMRQKNLELNESNATKDKFFAIIAHDLRGPTHTLTSFLELLDTEFNHFDKNEFRKILRKLHTTSANLSNLLDNLLRWARLQTNKMEFKPEKLKLSEQVEKSCDVLNHMAETKEIEVEVDVDEKLQVVADQNMLETILRNILSNAFKFTGNKGKVSIAAKNGQDMVSTQISDTGVGIARENLDKLLNITENHHTTGTGNESGSGLGLILVNDFVKKNGGHLQIESEPGKGTTVTFTLPLA